MSRLYNKKEVSKVFNCSLGKVDLMMNDGLRYVKLGKNVRFRNEDINEYIEKNVVMQFIDLKLNM